VDSLWDSFEVVPHSWTREGNHDQMVAERA
jgi:hypothetical protein